MKKIFLVLLLLFLPIILAELFLYTDHLYTKSILLNYHLRGWQQASPDGYTWPDILVMGSSVARQDIDPQILQTNLMNKGIRLHVGSIALVADATSTDYYTLKRIVETCTHCPRKIVYIPTDVAVKKHEIDSWKDITGKRLRNLYLNDTQNLILLTKASRLDQNYAVYLADLSVESISRLYFTRRQLFSLIKLELYAIFFTHGSISEAYSNTKAPQDSEYGFNSYLQPMSKTVESRSLDEYKNNLANYETGGATGLFEDNFFSLAKQKKIAIVIVIPPLYQSYQTNFKYQQNIFKKYISSLGQKYHYKIIDDSAFNQYTRDYFFDVNHLDLKGAENYSQHLADKLQFN